MTIHPDLLTILACPKCKGRTDPLGAGEGLACPTCGVVYPVRDDIPIMLVEEAWRKQTGTRASVRSRTDAAK
ncbi:MAG: Trm112 family protein [Solidesulfovibrio sp.]